MRPQTATGEYDIDLVCRNDISQQQITQADLKQTVGDALQRYLQWKASRHEHDGPSSCQPSRRCWTLSYPAHSFHMDVLPAIPDPDKPPTGILLPDTNLQAWQHSNPIGYAKWFRSRSEEMLIKLTEAARDLRASVDDVPEWRVRSTLQRMVQVLKWHTSVHFADEPDNRPPSILITTLAAQGYGGQTNLFTATLDTVRRMPDHIQRRAGCWWVPNPVHDKENFADKWNEYPSRREAFYTWLGEITTLLDELGRMEGAGIDRVTARLSESFGAGPIKLAAQQVAEEFRTRREAAGLFMAAGTGALGSSAYVKVRDHTFYGAPTTTPRA